MNNQIKFELMAQQAINDSMSPSETPFRSAVSDALSAVSTTFKAIDNVAGAINFATIELKFDQMDSLLSKARRMDAKNDRDALLAQLQANELRKAMEAQNA